MNKFTQGLTVLGMVFALAVVPTVYYFRWAIIFSAGILTILWSAA